MEGKLEDEGEFTAEMRIKTQAVHDQSDKLINVKLAAVLSDQNVWAAAVAEFYHIFAAIEDALTRCKEHDHVGPLLRAVEKSFRQDAFERDLQFYLGDDWKTLVKPSPCVEEYCSRIAYVADKKPTLLVAYVHSMYLAMLAGGQIIKRIVKKTLGLADDQGLELFEFCAVDRKELRCAIKAAIDGLQLSRQQKDDIIAEKIRIFRMNNDIAKNIKTPWSSYKKIAIFASFVVVVPVLLGCYFYKRQK